MATGTSAPIVQPESTMVGVLFDQAHKEIRTQINECAKNLVGGPENVYNLVADLTEKEISSAADDRKLREFLLTTRSYTSCVDAAPRVFGLITDENQEVTSVTSSGQFGDLADEIKKMPPNANLAINARFGSQHGFVIVIRGDQTEILQSFGGRKGAPLTDSFSGRERRTFTREALVSHLHTSMSQEPGGASQKLLFGGAVQHVQGEWVGRPLLSETVIKKNMKDKMTDGLVVLNSDAAQHSVFPKGKGEKRISYRG